MRSVYVVVIDVAMFPWSKTFSSMETSVVEEAQLNSNLQTGEGGEFKLSNRGNKLTGEENPGSIRPRIWSNKRPSSTEDMETDFETYEKMFMRKIKYSSSSATGSDIPFVRFLNEFEAQKGLFSREGIDLDNENLAKRPLSRYTLRALQSRHLEVLVTLLMLKIEEEQEEYRKLMRLAEELCIEDFNFIKSDDDEDGGDVKMSEGAVEEVFKRDASGLEGIDAEEVLQLKALCHEHLHLKRVYISTLRKIRSGAVYSLFQANGLYDKLNRLDRKLALIRSSGDDQDQEDIKEGEESNRGEKGEDQ